MNTNLGNQWGFSVLEIEPELLSSGTFGLRRAGGAFQDGTCFSMPDGEPLPEPLVIPVDARDQIVVLTLPVDLSMKSGNPPRPSDSDLPGGSVRNVTRRVKLGLVSIRDMATLSQSSTDGVLGGSRDYTLIPVAHIMERQPDRVMLDSNFIPTVLVCDAAPQLAVLLGELRGLLRERSEALLSLAARTTHEATMDIADFHVLQTVTRYGPMVAQLAAAPCHPERMYALLIEIAGALLTESGEASGPQQFPDYRHADLTATFHPVIQAIRARLNAVADLSTVPAREDGAASALPNIFGGAQTGTSAAPPAVSAAFSKLPLARGPNLPPPLVSAMIEVPKIHVDKNLQFTVYRPRQLHAFNWQPFLAFAHLAERAADAPETEPDPLEEVAAQAEAVLGQSMSDYRTLVQPASQDVPRESQLTFLPDARGLQFDPPQHSFQWKGTVHRALFLVKAGPEVVGQTLRGRLSVFFGSIMIAEVSFNLSVTSQSSGDGGTQLAPTNSVRRFRRIFPSYSHRDESIVAEFARYARVLGDEYLQDVLSLRSGEVWDTRLKQLIAEADVFQLFWSWNSIDSPFVRAEWEHALALNRPEFIRPLYWQVPLPSRPESNLPPTDLRRVHFQMLPTRKNFALGGAMDSIRVPYAGAPPSPTSNPGPPPRASSVGARHTGGVPTADRPSAPSVAGRAPPARNARRPVLFVALAAAVLCCILVLLILWVF